MRMAAVFSGGVVGGLLRACFMHGMHSGVTMVWVIAAINVLGCVGLGVWQPLRRQVNESILYLGFSVGICGGFTTFSEAATATLSNSQLAPGMAVIVLASSLVAGGIGYGSVSKVKSKLSVADDL